MKAFLKVFAVAVFFVTMLVIGPTIEPYVELFVSQLFINFAWFFLFSVVIVYIITIVEGWPNRKLDIPDGK